MDFKSDVKKIGIAITATLVLALTSCSLPVMSEQGEIGTSTDSRAVKRTINVSSTSQIQNALKNALPGDKIVIAAGTYTGSSSSSGDSNSMFYSAKNGTSTDKIYLEAASGATVTLQGTSTSSKYVFYLKGDYWEIKNIKFKTGNQGIMTDGASYNYYYKLEVSNIGQEAIHLRDGSKNNVLESCYVHHTGLADARYGEGFYVGSDVGKWGTYAKECDNNTIKYCKSDNTKAESVDVKEGSTNTVITNCTFSGAGMSDADNGGDSYVDAKGNKTIIKYNTVTQNGGRVLEAFSGDSKSSGWGVGTDINNNTVKFDSGNTSAYVIRMRNSASAKETANTRSPTGNMWIGTVTHY